MDPIAYEAFASEFTAEWNRMQAAVSAEIMACKAEHTRVRSV